MKRAGIPDWAAARRDTWRRQIGGLETMLAPAGSIVRGFDLSPALIEFARRRAGRRHASLARRS